MSNSNDHGDGCVILQRTLHPLRLSRQAPVLAIVGWKEKIVKGPQKNDLISSD